MSSLKRAFVGAAAVLVTAGLGATAGAVAPAQSALAPASAVAAVSATKARTFKNCTALHKVYRHGVKKSSSTKDVVRSKGKTTKRASKAKVSKALYNANKRLDRDRDGIACERR